MRHSGLRLLVVVAILLTACDNSLDRRYLDTSLGQPLELPPDLSRFETDSNFDLPESLGGAGGGNRVPVLAKIETLKLEGSGDLYWLSVEEPVESLYQKIKNFWAFEGYALVVDEPVIGIMQTEWIYAEEGGEKDESWWSSWFGDDDLSASQDQFHTRIERDESGEGSRIYITHRGTEYVYELRIGEQAGDDEPNTWHFRQPEPELEVEMLSRLMIYLGLQQEEVDAQLANRDLFKPRASMQLDTEEESPYLIMLDPYHIAWNRVHQQLLRMNFDIQKADFKSGFNNEGEFVINAEIVDTDAGGGFFDFGASEERTTRQFTLVLLEETHELTRVIVEDQKGNYDTSPEGTEFLELLYEQIK